MKSIRELYIIGHGPSSSHTMGVGFACNFILEKYKNIKEITVILTIVESTILIKFNI